MVTKRFRPSFPNPDTVFSILGLAMAAFFVLLSLLVLPTVVDKYIPEQKSSVRR